MLEKGRVLFHNSGELERSPEKGRGGGSHRKGVSLGLNATRGRRLPSISRYVLHIAIHGIKSSMTASHSGGTTRLTRTISL